MKSFLILCLSLFAFAAFAGDPVTVTLTDSVTVAPETAQLPQPELTLDWLLTAQNGIYAVLLLLLTYMGNKIPFLKDIDDKGKRTLTVGLTLLAGVVVWQLYEKDLTWRDVVSTAITYILTTAGVYDKGLKFAGLKTKSPAKK